MRRCRGAGWRWWSAVGAFALWAAGAATAQAGIELTTELAAPQEQPRGGRMLLDSDRVRLEMATKSAKAADAARVLIYRGDSDVVWSLDDKRRTYTEVDRATMQKMRAQMEANLDKMPPEQRAPLQAMLAAGETMRRERPTVTPTGRTDTIAGLACRELEVARAGKKQSEICVAEWKAAGVTKDDLAAVGKLGKFQAEVFAGGRGSEGDDVLELFDELDGFPVRVRSFRGDQPRSELRIMKIVRTRIDPKLFEVPEGYTKRTVGGNLGAAP